MNDAQRVCDEALGDARNDSSGEPLALDYDSERAVTLINALSTAATNCAVYPFSEIGTVFAPTLAEGAPCRASRECVAPGHTCRALSNEATQRCHAPAIEGEACVDFADCAPNLVCQATRDDATSRCRGPGIDGSACWGPGFAVLAGGRSAPCAPEFACVADPLSEGRGVCAPFGVEGSPCGPSDPAELPNAACGADLFCDVEVCAPCVSLGDACDPSPVPVPQGECDDAAFCSVVEGEATGHCATALSNGSECTLPYQCASRLCDDEGRCAACATDNQCWRSVGGACVSGVCDPSIEPALPIGGSVPEGSACSADRECARGECLNHRCQLATAPADFCGPPL